MGRNVASCNVPSQNLFVRITVPRRTGRRRRKGNHDPFQLPTEETHGEGVQDSSKTTGTASSSTIMDVRTLAASLRDNPTTYAVSILGSITNTHRFRSLPDFVFSTKNSPFMRKIRARVAPLSYPAVKGFQLAPQRGFKVDEDLIPPPWFTKQQVPFDYIHRQHHGKARGADTEGQTHATSGTRSRVRIKRIAYDEPNVPQGPDSALPPLETLDPAAQELVKRILTKMEERPVWSRRALSNVMQVREWKVKGQSVLEYCFYEFRSGPWRDLAVRFGVDPRSDSHYRIYQSMVFQFDAEIRDPQKGKRRRKKLDMEQKPRIPLTGHIWDGKHVGLEGKTWQVCDIEEPIVKAVLSTSNIRRKCHVSIISSFPFLNS